MDRTARTLTRRLDGLLDRVRRRLLVRGVVSLLVMGGAALLAAAWTVGGPERPAAPVVWGLSLALSALLIQLVLRYVVQPLRGFRRRRDLVRSVEREGAHANLLVAAEESLRIPARWEGRGAAATVLLERLRGLALARIADLRLQDVAPLPDRRPLAVALALVLVLAVTLGLTAAGDLRRGTVLLATPWVGQPAPPTGGIYGLPTGPFAVAGDTVGLTALDLAALNPAAGDEDAVCEVKLGTGFWQPLPAQLKRPADGHAGRLWTAEVPDVRDDFQWRFRRGTIVSPERSLEVRDRPLLADLAARVEPPAYTNMPAQDMAHLPGWLEVPVGSRVTLRGRTSHAVVRAQLATDLGDTLVLVPDALTVNGTLEMRHSLAFRVHLEDAWGLANASPLRYEITAAADRAPAAQLERPDDDGLLPLEGSLILNAGADDDYGVAELVLELRTRGGGDTHAPPSWWSVPLLEGPPGTWSSADLGGTELRWRRKDLPDDEDPLQRRQRLELEIGGLRLVPGDVLELALLARDNRSPGPRGEGRSRVLRLLAPSAADVLAQHDESGAARQDELSEMRRRGRELGADLDRLTRELMKNPVPDWGRQQEMEDALRRQARLQQELARVADELQRELENLAQGQLTSDQQLRRAEEVAGLLQPENSDRLADLMRQLEEGRQRPSSQDVTRAVREVDRDQREMARRLDAALAMLERMARDQDLEGMTALLEQLIQKQQELAELSRQLAEEQASAATDSTGQDAGQDQGEQSGEGERGDELAQQDEGSQGQEEQQSVSPGATPEELARRQEALGAELEQLKERLEETIAEMKERQESGEASDAENQQQEALAEALERLEEQLAQGKMSEAAEQLQQMDPEQAARMQEQALRDLGSLYHVMLESQQAMQMAMQMNQATSLRGLAADLLAISARQEEIADQVPPRLREVRTLGLTRRQHRLQKATVQVRDHLSKLMTESPMRILRLLEKLDGLIEEMGHAVRAFEENRAPAARSYTRRALAAVNHTVIGLLTEAQMSSSSPSQGSSQSESAAEQLQELARQQAQLNGATDELRRMLADRGISQAERAQMQRLGEEQAQLAQRMHEVAEQEEERPRPDGDRLLGDLGALAEDMESVAGDLDTGLADEQVLARQDRILGRMLDARNSVRRRDFSSRRESRSSDRIYADREAPGAGTGVGEPDPNLLRYQPLERAPLAYRDLVRRYYAALDSLRRAQPEADQGGDLP